MTRNEKKTAIENMAESRSNQELVFKGAGKERRSSVTRDI